MKNREEYNVATPVMEVKMRKLSPAFTYVSSLHSEIYDLQQRLTELNTKKQIANFLMKTDAEKMHQLIEEVNSEIRNIQDRY